MNKNKDVADMVVREQLNRMLKQERVSSVFFFTPELESCHSKDQMLDLSLRVALMVKISILARFN